MEAPKTTWPYEWIDTDAALLSVIEAAKGERYIALDTETVGWQTGNEKLALIQVGLPSQKRSFIIDPFALSTLEPFEQILTTPTPLVVAHNAPFEERQFNRFGIKIRGIQDTLVMARNLRKDLPNHTLKTCCELILGIELSKEEQTSDWSVRPLSPSQLQYASLDVEVACALYDHLYDLDSRLRIDDSLSVEELMKNLSETVKDKFSLIRDVAPQLSFLENRYELLYQAIRNKLIAGDPPYKGAFGSCSVKKINKTEISPQKVRDQFPEIAPLAIKETVERKTILALMKEYGIDAKRLDDVLIPLNHEFRMSLSLGDESEDR